MKTLPLQIATNEAHIAELHAGVLCGELPGYQIRADVFTEGTVLAALAAQTATVVPEFSFNHHTDSNILIYGEEWHKLPPSVRSGRIITANHYDGEFLGVAVHINTGVGEVTLRGTDPRKYAVAEAHAKQKRENRCASAGTGPAYKGKLALETTVTVFGQNMTPYGGPSPVLHHFVSEGARHWRRITYAPPEIARLKMALPQ